MNLTLEELLRDLHKLKLSAEDVYLLALRQTLLNQVELLGQSVQQSQKGKVHDLGFAYQRMNESKDLADRISEFIEKRQ